MPQSRYVNPGTFPGGLGRPPTPAAGLAHLYSGSPPAASTGSHQAPLDNIPLGQEQTDNAGPIRHQQISRGGGGPNAWNRGARAAAQLSASFAVENLPKTTPWLLRSIIESSFDDSGSRPASGHSENINYC